MPPIAPSNNTQAATPRRAGLGAAFGNLFTANLSSSLGDGIARVAAPLLAVRLTDDPLLISGIAVVAMLPWLFFALPAGILLDRIDRRQALAAANGLRTLVAVGLLALHLADGLTIWWLYAVVLVYGALETVYDGAIRAVVPSIVDRPDLPRANSRIEAGEIVVQQFLSQPLTSWLLAASAVWALGLNAGAYALAGGLALFLPAAAAGAHVRRRSALPAQEASPPRPKTSWREETAAGLRFIWSSDMLRPLWILSIAIGICHAAVTSTLVLFVLDQLVVPEAWYGTFILSGAAGALFATTVAGRLKERFGTGRTMAWANILGLVAWIVAGALPSVPLAAACLFVTFGCTVVWNVLVMSLRQAAIPSALLGRVHGTWRTLLWGAMPIGSLLGGLLARGGLSLPLVVGGAAGLVIAAVGYRTVARLPNPEDLPPH
ncbi:MFS transporter [Antribacter gilvus]|uniref:MFS transporter n=1 Tax=Antribacter gilvus TaxID=2304675 RepID=UPI000F79045C|nr:MFS transporter [Antribacter gilvus]